MERDLEYLIEQLSEGTLDISSDIKILTGIEWLIWIIKEHTHITHIILYFSQITRHIIVEFVKYTVM